MENQIEILTIQFKTPISDKEIKWFRGAVIHALQNDNILFHNHTPTNYRYSYPLIQYKRIDQWAAIVCINEGVAAMGDFFANYTGEMTIGNQRKQMEIESLKPALFTIKLWEHMSCYKIKRWLPLNSRNYAIYNQIESLVERIEFLEKILIGNILAFTKGVGIFLEKELVCRITEITRSYPIMNKEVNMEAFDIKFVSNISLPDYIGLGKNVSINCGIVVAEHACPKADQGSPCCDKI